MRLFRRKKNNKGFSLVEVVCAVAILGLTSTAIGTTMVVSNQNYQRGNAEVDVQKEAQTTTNLIGNLIVDSGNVTPDYYADSTTIKSMKIEGEKKEYEIYYDKDAGTITYKEKVKVGEEIQESSGTLATDVTDFKGDFSNYSATGSKNVSLELAMNKNGRNYEATYATTSRNGVAEDLGARKAARITCESEVTLEPGQSYYLPITVHGMNADEANIAWTQLQPGEAGSNVGATSNINGDAQGATITIDKDAKGVLQFTVKTQVEPVTDPAVNDSKTITVNIRRVTGVNVVGNRTNDVEPATAGAIYRVNATALGTSLNKVIGKAYDDGSVDSSNEYKNPKYMDFTFTMSTGANASDYVEVISAQALENTDAPYVDFKLKQSIPGGASLTVTATSKHGMGVFEGEKTNKTGTDYGAVIGTYEIINEGSVISLTSGLERGEDCLDFITELDLENLKKLHGGNISWLFRYRTLNGTWSQYYKTKESGSEQKMNAVETYLFDVNTEYEFELAFTLVDWTNKKLMWPHDETLLEPGKGFAEHGIIKGWTEDGENYDEASKNPSAYGQVFKLGATEIGFTGYGSTIIAQNTTNLPSGADEFVRTAGTASNPIILKRNKDLNIDDRLEIKLDYANLCKDKYTPSVVLQVPGPNGQWVDTANSKFTYQTSGGADSSVKINNIDQNQVPVGSYRLKVRLVNQDKGYIQEGSNIENLIIQKQANGTWDLFGKKLIKQENGSEVSTEYGYVYFDIIN